MVSTRWRKLARFVRTSSSSRQRWCLASLQWRLGMDPGVGFHNLPQAPPFQILIPAFKSRDFFVTKCLAPWFAHLVDCLATMDSCTTRGGSSTINASCAHRRSIFLIARVFCGICWINLCCEARLGTVVCSLVLGVDGCGRARNVVDGHNRIIDRPLTPFIETRIPTSKFSIPTYGTVPRQIISPVETRAVAVAVEIRVDCFIFAACDVGLRTGWKFFVWVDFTCTQAIFTPKAPVLEFIHLEALTPNSMAIMCNFFR